MGGWHLRMTWVQSLFSYASQQTSVRTGLATVWLLWGNLGMARCQEMSTLPAGYILQHKVTSGSSSGSLGFIVCVKCCRMVPRWWLSLSWPIQSDHLSMADQMIPPMGRKHSHGKTQCIAFLESRTWWGPNCGKQKKKHCLLLIELVKIDLWAILAKQNALCPFIYARPVTKETNLEPKLKSC